MPTATSLSGVQLINLGPLTTTFTAPASCSTAAYRTMIAPASFPSAVEWDDACSWEPPADCDPQGSAVNSLISAGSGDNPTANMFMTYNSPGLICPTGWSTVGAAAKLNPTSINISGAANDSDAIPTGSHVEFFEPGLDVFFAALDPGETAHLCCPSSYEARSGGCYSNIPSSSFTPTVGCERILPAGDVSAQSTGQFTIAGETITGALISITGTTPISTLTTSFATPGAYIGVAFEGMYILVHQSSDLAATSTGSTASGTPTNTATGTGTGKPSSAVRVRSSEYGLTFLAVCGLSFVLGALLLV